MQWNRIIKLACIAIVGFAINGRSGTPGAKEELYVATPLTAENSFTPGIEGPNCDAEGNVYVVNFARQQTIGKVTPDGLFSAIEFECLGSCTTAPVMQVNGEFYENLDVKTTEAIIDQLRNQ